MTDTPSTSGPLLQLLANGLSLWIRSQCDEVGDLNLGLNGSALQLLRGHLKGVTLAGRFVTFQGLPIQRAELRSGPLDLNIKPSQPGQMLQLQNSFDISGSVVMRGSDLNRALLTQRWRWLGDWLAEQLMGLSTLGNLEIDNDTLVLTSPLVGQGEVVRKEFRLDAAEGTLRITRFNDDSCVLLPMDPNIRILEAHLKARQLHLVGQAAVTP